MDAENNAVEPQFKLANFFYENGCCIRGFYPTFKGETLILDMTKLPNHMNGAYVFKKEFIELFAKEVGTNYDKIKKLR